MASINSLQALGWPVSARTLAAASSALNFLASAPTSLVFLDLAFLGFFDAAMTCLPFLGVSNKGQRDVRAAAREGSVLGCAMKSRQFRLRSLRFRQVLSRLKNLRNPLMLALRWALLRGSVNSVGWRFRVLRERRTVCT